MRYLGRSFYLDENMHFLANYSHTPDYHPYTKTNILIYTCINALRQLPGRRYEFYKYLQAKQKNAYKFHHIAKWSIQLLNFRRLILTTKHLFMLSVADYTLESKEVLLSPWATCLLDESFARTKSASISRTFI